MVEIISKISNIFKTGKKIKLYIIFECFNGVDHESYRNVFPMGPNLTRKPLHAA